MEREGSRVGFKKGAERIVVHRPHPGPEIGRATVRDIAKFLAAAGAMTSREQDDEQGPSYFDIRRADLER